MTHNCACTVIASNSKCCTKSQLGTQRIFFPLSMICVWNIASFLRKWLVRVIQYHSEYFFSPVWFSTAVLDKLRHPRNLGQMWPIFCGFKSTVRGMIKLTILAQIDFFPPISADLLCAERFANITAAKKWQRPKLFSISHLCDRVRQIWTKIASVWIPHFSAKNGAPG